MLESNGDARKGRGFEPSSKFVFHKKRLYPESNGDARKGRGFEPRAIPLCDTGIFLFAQSEFFGNAVMRYGLEN